MTSYEELLANKRPVTHGRGLSNYGTINPMLFPFQREMVEWALQLGKAAIFADCGLGKGPCQLEWARHIAEHGRVLILAPLAVSQQTVREGEKFGVDVHYAKDQSEVKGPITISNYERAERFDPTQFIGVVNDESGILKSYMGKTKQYLMSAFAGVKHKLCLTATPAPNDHLELGNHCHYLGVMTSSEMISRWFINDTSHFGTCTYRLKHYAVAPFWDWVSSWARCVGVPSDLRDCYDDTAYQLPELEIHRHIVDVDITVDRGEHLFRMSKLSATDVHKERRRTAADRARCIADLVAAEPHEQWLVWCDTNYEADELIKAFKAANLQHIEVRGSQSLDTKESKLESFSSGAERILITKPKIAGFGLNWQHCARVAYIGPTFSWEAWYQSIRRAWRFGQKRPVQVHIAMAPTEVEIWSVLMRKKKDHEVMQKNMFAAMRRAQHKADSVMPYNPDVRVRFPEWLRTA
jgi:superfamily II DNA or RNA helicase